MDIRNFLKIDLVGRLDEYKKRYDADLSIFDHKLVKISIRWNTVFASSYSNSIHAPLNNHLEFYRSKEFRSFYEARGHAEMEIAKAMLRFPQTRFVLTAENPAGWTECSQYRNGERIDVDLNDSASFGALCYCGARFEGTTCPKCGEWRLD